MEMFFQRLLQDCIVLKVFRGEYLLLLKEALPLLFVDAYDLQRVVEDGQLVTQLVGQVQYHGIHGCDDQPADCDGAEEGEEMEGTPLLGVDLISFPSRVGYR